MSDYRICVIKNGQNEATNHIDFDNKEDAEHYAKNHSSNDAKNRYEVQKNDRGEFMTIKAYLGGQVI